MEELVVGSRQEVFRNCSEGALSGKYMYRWVYW